MYRPHPLAAVLCLLLPLSAVAQIGPPPKPTATRPTVMPQPAPTPLPRAVNADRTRADETAVQSNARTGQQLRTQPIQSTRPGQVTPIQAPAATPKVYDRNGRIIPGVKPAGANRVLDTRTGKYYDSVPSGNGQQIKP